MGKVNTVMSDFYCTQCGNKGLPVWRRKGAEREAGHLKKLFCLYCGTEQNHVECKPFTKYSKEDFDVEFAYHNFTPEGQRVRPYGELRRLINNGEIKKDICNGGSSRFGEIDLDPES